MESMGHFTAIGMRQAVTDPNALVINTCSDNDTNKIGDSVRWSWANPTNRKYGAVYEPQPGERIAAFSTECLWQGTKIYNQLFDKPREYILLGDWRKGKGKRPLGHWGGKGQPLITSPGEARRRIYIPAFREQLQSWVRDSEEVRGMLHFAKTWDGPVLLRDFDTGRGIDRNGPMSHAWLMATWLNEGLLIW